MVDLVLVVVTSGERGGSENVVGLLLTGVYSQKGVLGLSEGSQDSETLRGVSTGEPKTL